MKLHIGLLALALSTAGCASSKVSYTTRPTSAPAEALNSVAMSPSGGVLADAIAIELSNAGYQVFDGQQTSQLFARLNLDEFEIAKPQSLALLKDKGVDAYLVVRGAAGRDGLPQSATVRLTGTESGKIITGVTWQNGWGGQSGSIADRQMRKDVAEAAEEVTRALLKGMRSK